MLKLGKVLITTVAMGTSLYAFSVGTVGQSVGDLHTYFSGGMKWATAKTNSTYTTEAKFTEQEYRIGVNYVPWNLPVSVGTYFGVNLGNTLNLTNATATYRNTKATNAWGMDFAVDFTVWAPEGMFPAANMLPFVKFAYVPLTRYVREYEYTGGNNGTDGTTLKLQGHVPGWNMNFGTQFTLNEQFGATVEYSYNSRNQDLTGNEKNKVTNNYTVNQSPVLDNRTYASHGVLVGVNAKL